MSQYRYSCNSPCCRPAQLVVEEFCENFNVGGNTTETIWADANGQQANFTISVSGDSNAPAGVTITTSSGGTRVYTLQPGRSITVGENSVVSLDIVTGTPGLNTTGIICIKVNRKFR